MTIGLVLIVIGAIGLASSLIILFLTNDEASQPVLFIMFAISAAGLFLGIYVLTMDYRNRS